MPIGAVKATIVSASAFGLSNRILAGLVLAVIAGMGAAQAHPLGNFTINHLARLEPEGGQLRVHYVLDIAEIPTFQIMHGGGGLGPKAMRDWQNAEALLVAKRPVDTRQRRRATPTLARNDGADASEAPEACRSSTGPGITRRRFPHARRYPCAIRSMGTGASAGRILFCLVWSIRPTSCARIPSALIGSPRQNDAATFDVLGGGRIVHVQVERRRLERMGLLLDRAHVHALSDLFARNGQTPVLILLTILAAFGLGALHGLEPGHGKALLAFTLVGARATFKQAVILAGALTFAHTIAVLLLGLVLFFSAGFATESLFTWITLISGLAVAGIGARGSRSRRAHRSPAGTPSRARARPAARPRSRSRRRRARSFAFDSRRGSVAFSKRGRRRDERRNRAMPRRDRRAIDGAAIASSRLRTLSHRRLQPRARRHPNRPRHRRRPWRCLAAAAIGIRTDRARSAPFLTSIVISTIGSVMVGQALVQRGVPASVSAIALVVFLGVALYAARSRLFSSRSTHRILAIKETT